MPSIKKAYEITDAKISFVSLVDRAANKRQFVITKSTDGKANFSSVGKIIKSDAEQHCVTGIVYEPMTEDTQGNYMTEEEITKAAHWFAKNGNQVDIQHCFVKAEGVEVVESFVAKCDMEIEGQSIKKGTWVMTAEITNDDIWTAIEKGEITGFSMGGCGTYSTEDVELPVEKQDEPKGLFRKLAKAMGFDVIEKGAVKANYNRRVKEDNFYSAWHALRSSLEGNFYNPETGNWEWGYNSDENTIREALEDFNEIVTKLLSSDSGIIKSLEKAASEAPESIIKAGKCLSNKNLNAIKGIRDSIDSFIAEFDNTDCDDNTDDSKKKNGSADNNIKKEENDMKAEEIKAMIGEAVTKAIEPINAKLEAIAKEDKDAVSKADNVTSENVTTEAVSKMVDEAVSKAIEPVSKSLDALLKSRALPGNLNDAAGTVEKSGEEPHYMTGIF